jgi:K+-transporting ATPase ATPase B chain
LIVCVTLPPRAPPWASSIDHAELVALFVCLIPTTIGGLLPAIGIAGMDRALRANVLAKSGKAVEVAGDIDVLLLDKTGTITLGARQATQFIARCPASLDARLREAAALASLGIQPPKGAPSWSWLARLAWRRPACAGATFRGVQRAARACRGWTCPTGVPDPQGRGQRDRRVRSPKAVRLPARARQVAEQVARAAAPRWWSLKALSCSGVIALVDVLKPGIKERFARLREMGIRR